MPKLRFLQSHGYGGQIVRRGSVIEVADFQAVGLIQKGIAIPETMTQELQTESTPNVETAKQPQRRGRKRK